MRTRRILVPLAVAVAFVVSAASWLTGSGSTTPQVNPAQGLATGGIVADVVTLSPTISRSIGSSVRQSGKAVARVRIAKDSTAAVRVTVSWENPLDAAAVLNNPNPQISLGLYRPVSLKNGSNACSVTNALAVTDGLTYCTIQDTGATGSASVDANGELLLGPGVITGFFEPSVAAPTAPTCLLDAEPLPNWCQPALALAETHQRVLYVVASITIPGGVPLGHSSAPGVLSLQVSVR